MLHVRTGWLLALMLLTTGLARAEVARYAGEGLVVFVERTGRDTCRGEIHMDREAYPFTGRMDGPEITGQFVAGGDRFDFTATLDAEGMTLKTGDDTYRLAFAPQQRGDDPDPNPVREPRPRREPAPRDDGQLEPLAWMKPGVRITYYDSKNKQTLFGAELEPDPNGEWIDRKTKKRYSEKTILGGRDDLPAVAGYGLRQHDIVAVEDGVVAVDTKSFSPRPDLNNIWILAPGGTSVIGNYESGVELYIHPRKLAAMLADAEAIGDQGIYRCKFAAMNRQFEAVRIVTRVSNGVFQQTYDLETGLLLYQSSALTGERRQGPDEDIRREKNDEIYVQRGETTFTFMTIVGMREVELPRGSDRAGLPAVFRQGGQLLWRGTVKMHVAGAENLPNPGNPVAFAVSMLQSGKTFAVAGVKDVSPGAIDVGLPPPCRAVGPASVGGWCVAPQIFDGLQPNQPLDRDPLTGNEILYLGQQDGLHWVTERGPQHNFLYGYDPQTGVARRMINTLPLTGLTYDVQLTER